MSKQLKWGNEGFIRFFDLKHKDTLIECRMSM